MREVALASPWMRGAPEKIAGMWLVLLAGIGGAIYGVALLALSRHVDIAAGQAACGLALIAWVIFHPTRVPETPTGV